MVSMYFKDGLYIIRDGWYLLDDMHCANEQPLGSRGRSLNLSCNDNRRVNNSCMDGVGRGFWRGEFYRTRLWCRSSFGPTPSTPRLGLFLSNSCPLCVSHVHTSVAACVVMGWTVAAYLTPLFLLWYLRLTPCIYHNIIITAVFISVTSFVLIIKDSPSWIIVGFVTILCNVWARRVLSYHILLQLLLSIYFRLVGLYFCSRPMRRIPSVERPNCNVRQRRLDMLYHYT